MVIDARVLGYGVEDVPALTAAAICEHTGCRDSELWADRNEPGILGHAHQCLKFLPTLGRFGSVIRTVITQLALLGTITLGVFLAGSLEEMFSSALKTVLILGTFALALAAAIWEVVGSAQGRPHKYKGRRRDAKILKYMTKLLSSEEQCVMSSNDLSWVKGEARDALLRKARKRSLTLLMPQQNQLSKELETAGATVIYYGDDDYKFLSRFTLVNPDRADARVAIGYTTRDAHLIRVIQDKDDPATHLVDDLYSFIKRSAREKSAR